MVRQKWSKTQKNPDNSLRNQSIDTVSYWQGLNNLPQKTIKQVVNTSILDKDQQACDLILTKIFQHKQTEESIQEI